MYNVYQVKLSDTLESIANNFGITKEELISINDFKDNIKYGDMIVVPKGRSNFTNYIIQKGDTMYSIAKKYNVDVNSLMNMNGLNPNEYIYPGETLLIPMNIKTYTIQEGDTLNDLLNKMSIDELLKQNSNIYLLPSQVIVYGKE